MEKLSAFSGWNWIKQGFVLFRRQPAEMSTLFMLYVFLTVLLSLIPVIGLILRFLLLPAFSMAFMQACADIEQDKRVYPRTLFSAFRQPAFKSLTMLGGVYLLAALLALGVTMLFNGTDFWLVFDRQSMPDQKEAEDSALVLAMLSVMTSYLSVYLSISLLLWFAPPLIAWQNMSVGKAIFFSFFSVLRAFKAFCIYMFAWVTIGVGLMVFLSGLLEALFDNEMTKALILLPFGMLILAVVQCSFYPSYKQLFGAQQAPEAI